MKIQRTVKIEDYLYKWLEVRAEENCRSFAGQIEFLVKQEIKREGSDEEFQKGGVYSISNTFEE